MALIKRGPTRGPRRGRNSVGAELGDLYKISGDEYSYASNKKFEMEDDESGGEDNMELDNIGENSIFKDVAADKAAPYRPMTLKEEMVKIGSQDYYTYIKYLQQIMDQKNGNHFICLTCWKFVSFHQQKQHERAGHQCAKPMGIKDEASFMLNARTFAKVTPNGYVQKFAVYDRTHFDKNVRNGQLIPMKDQIQDGQKGKPPFLASPMIPMNYMIPSKNGTANTSDELKNNIGKPGGSLNLAYDQYEKEKLVQVLGRLQNRMDYIENTVQDMLHKIKLIMMKEKVIKEAAALQDQRNNVQYEQNDEEKNFNMLAEDEEDELLNEEFQFQDINK